MENLSKNTFNDLYDRYAAMVYGIALKLADSELEAAMILSAVFTKLQKGCIIKPGKTSLCIALIKLTAEAAQEISKNNETGNRLKYFEHTPFLHKLLCGNMLNVEV